MIFYIFFLFFPFQLFTEVTFSSNSFNINEKFFLKGNRIFIYGNENIDSKIYESDFNDSYFLFSNPQIFNLNNYEIDKDKKFYNDFMSEIGKLKIDGFYNKNKKYYLIDFISLDEVNFPILSSFLIKDFDGNNIGFEAIYLIPLLIDNIRKKKSEIIEGIELIEGELIIKNNKINISGNLDINNNNNYNGLNNDFKVEIQSGKNNINIGNNSEGNIFLGNKNGDLNLIGNNLNFSGTFNIKAKNDDINYGSIAFGLLLNESYILRGYSSGEFTIGNIEKISNLIGDEVFIVAKKNIMIGEVGSNHKINLISGIEDINIGSLKTSGDIIIGNNNLGHGEVKILPLIDLSSNEGGLYNVILNNNGVLYRSKNKIIENDISSRKYKKNIREVKVDIEKFKKLVPIIFDYIDEVNSGKKNKWGLIAEDVYDLGFEDLIEFDEKGEIRGLDYKSIFIMLLSSYLDSLKRIDFLEKILQNNNIK